jgi:hypothetical protein
MTVPGRALLTEEVTAVAIDPPTFIFDSDLDDGDPATIRNGLLTNVILEIRRGSFGDPASDRDYRIIYRLLDKDGIPLNLKNTIAGQLTVGTGPSFPVVRSGFNTLAFTKTEKVYPDPLGTLGNKDPYRVIAALQRRADFTFAWGNVVGSDFTSPAALAHHFTETFSGDTEYNVKATVSNLSGDRKDALQTDSGLDSFIASIDTVFARYDNWDDAIGVVTTTAELDFDLIEVSTGISINRIQVKLP